MADNVNGLESRKRPADTDAQDTQRKRRKSDQGESSKNSAGKAGVAKSGRKAQQKKGGAKFQNKGEVRITSGTSVLNQGNTEDKHASDNENASTSEGEIKESSGQASRKGVRPTPAFRKLDPPKPFPAVPASVSATGPKSQHHEGKNMIMISRKTKLAAYLRRCKDLIVKDGYVYFTSALACTETYIHLGIKLFIYTG